MFPKALFKNQKMGSNCMMFFKKVSPLTLLVIRIKKPVGDQTYGSFYINVVSCGKPFVQSIKNT